MKLYRCRDWLVSTRIYTMDQCLFLISWRSCFALHFLWGIYLGDNCIIFFHLERYIVGYTVGNLVLLRHASGFIQSDVRLQRKCITIHSLFSFSKNMLLILVPSTTREQRYRHKGSYMSDHVLLNLLNKLEIKCEAYLIFATSLMHSIIQEHEC